jgi:hypothetical protein
MHPIPTWQDLSKQMLLLNHKDVKELVEFRHGFVHRLSQRIHKQSPPLLLEFEKNTWDSLPIGTVRTRQIVHLASYTWRLIIRATRAIARLSTPPIGFICKTRSDEDLKKFDWNFGIHSGIGIRNTPYGPMFVRCTKQCWGFRAEFDRTAKLDDLFDLLRNRRGASAVADVISPFFLKVLPDMEPETRAREIHFKYFVMRDAKSSHPVGLIVLLAVPGTEGLSSTMVEDAIEGAKRHLHEGFKGIKREEAMKLFKGSAESWPEEAKKALRQMARGTNPSFDPISRNLTSSKTTRYHVVFNPATREELDPIDKASLQLMILEREEPLL